MQTTVAESQLISRYKGLAMAFLGASLWGLSGTAAQYLFQHEGIRPGWLVTIRLIIAGVLLLALGLAQVNRDNVWSVWKSRQDRIQLMIFGLLGMLGVQYTYFAAIEAGNAATATLLQFLGPVFITLYLALRFRRIPGLLEFLALGLALLGTFLLVTNGSTEELSISGAAVAWGLGAAVTAAFYTLYPVNLLRKWGSLTIVGWGMAIGGIGLSLVNPPWQMDGLQLTSLSWSLIGFVILFGTLIPFYLVLESLRYISPAEAGMLNSAEPLAAVLASVLWLSLSLGLFEAIGGVCIIFTVLLLAMESKKKEKRLLGKEPPVTSKSLEG
ncbi:EamA family transporter [Effusibacillus lacus]|uniref:EamA family transporter n=1 Tax=Effusibacillus lacus TaxID=1348429 RepID=A0A292YJB8_9BACL|nr:DMT family transporter [Effusibacillus lacus]TCS76864.1 threonine/homoserine efflux transporter RhtA [Effusibacillus lacus]GAX91197.1 EamA family transporter [Effusibacillus lacus]